MNRQGLIVATLAAAVAACGGQSKSGSQGRINLGAGVAGKAVSAAFGGLCATGTAFASDDAGNRSSYQFDTCKAATLPLVPCIPGQNIKINVTIDNVTPPDGYTLLNGQLPLVVAAVSDTGGPLVCEANVDLNGSAHATVYLQSKTSPGTVDVTITVDGESDPAGGKSAVHCNDNFHVGLDTINQAADSSVLLSVKGEIAYSDQSGRTGKDLLDYDRFINAINIDRNFYNLKDPSFDGGFTFGVNTLKYAGNLGKLDFQAGDFFYSANRVDARLRYLLLPTRRREVLNKAVSAGGEYFTCLISATKGLAFADRAGTNCDPAGSTAVKYEAIKSRFYKNATGLALDTTRINGSGIAVESAQVGALDKASFGVVDTKLVTTFAFDAQIPNAAPCGGNNFNYIGLDAAGTPTALLRLTPSGYIVDKLEDLHVNCN